MKFLKNIRDLRTWRRFKEKLGVSRRELQIKDGMRDGCNSRVLGYTIGFDRIRSTKFLEHIRDLRTW